MLRAVKDTDLDRLEQLWLHAAAHSHPSLSRRFWLDRRHQFRLDHLGSKSCIVFTDRHAAVAEAFITITKDGRLAYLCVSPLFSNRGIGAQLISKVSRGLPSLQAELLRENLRTRYFLQKHGFVERDRHYKAEYGQHMIVMSHD
ncbi:GNAT family N-acetyltransferase [Microbulbifer sp. A4B17]|uniref:GNAT family N-acetyltransferase n=1 Tax=Microbulbifer sp. A4B17 TaxID=359370 RepID=UPI00130061D9|nr:GNAT family N-acetyltransferase [Microbulbifer sp. A4B17]